MTLYVESSKETTIHINLRLNEETARWLMANLQNPLQGQDRAEEPSRDTAMRSSLFNALKKELSQ